MQLLDHPWIKIMGQQVVSKLDEEFEIKVL